MWNQYKYFQANVKYRHRIHDFLLRPDVDNIELQLDRTGNQYGESDTIVGQYENAFMEASVDRGDGEQQRQGDEVGHDPIEEHVLNKSL